MNHRRSRNLLWAARKPFERRGPEGLELPALDRCPCVLGQPQDETEIMQTQKAESQDFVLVDEMADVRAREARAGGAVAVVLERTLVARRSGRSED